ncbi:MAG: hypothetical protein AB8B63_20155 [Granulosicoccus sp.]
MRIRVSMLMVFTLTACGGGGDSDTVVSNDDPLPSLPPADAAALTSILTTRYDSSESYEYWRCEHIVGVSFILLPARGTFGDDVQRGFELTNPGEQGTATIWSAISADALMIEVRDNGQAFDFTNLTFADVDTVRIGGGTNAPQNCVRGSYGTIESTPTTTDAELPANNGPDGLVAMYGVIVFRLLPSGFFGPTDDAILAFNNGSYTEDIAGVMSDGVDASRAARPQDWGLWRGTAGALELQEANETGFEETSGSWLIQPGTADQRLNDCFSALGGAGSLGDGGFSNVTFSTVCFYENGRFTHDSALWAQGPVADITVSNPHSQGQYRIDGHVAEFVYDSGRAETVAFGFSRRDPESGVSIYLNDDLHLD